MPSRNHQEASRHPRQKRFAQHQLKLKPHRFGKQNSLSIHHAAQRCLFFRAAFILRERRVAMVNAWLASNQHRRVAAVNLALNDNALQHADY
jgi:hypothetical protein